MLTFAALRERIGRQRMRSMMRGYRRLRRVDRLDLIVRLKDDLTNVPPVSSAEPRSALVFGAALPVAALSVEQYLIVYLMYLRFDEALQRSLGQVGKESVPLAYPLPRAWREEAERRGIQVAHVRSALLWSGLTVALLGYGILKAAQRLFSDSWAMLRNRAAHQPGRSAFFSSVGTANLPPAAGERETHNIMTWYMRWQGKQKRIAVLRHCVPQDGPRQTEGAKVVRQDRPVLPLDTWGRLARYAGWIVGASAVSILQLLRGRWAEAVMFAEASTAAALRVSSDDAVPAVMLFNNSNWLYRPLWSYEADRRGGETLFYFYSVNNESLARKGPRFVQHSSWQIANWPHYLVWGDHQAGFVRGYTRIPAQITDVETVWFSGDCFDLPRSVKPKIMVFDVQPPRDSFYQKLGAEPEYYTPRTGRKFLRDICDAVDTAAVDLFYKRKRDIGRRVHPHFRFFTDELVKTGRIKPLDPAISAFDLADQCDIILSMPYTTTALIGRAKGKPSAYYDPFGMLEKGDRAAHGIPMLTGPDELKAWLEQQLAALGSRRRSGIPIE